LFKIIQLLEEFIQLENIGMIIIDLLSGLPIKVVDMIQYVDLFYLI
jgi:hypothetical protein